MPIHFGTDGWRAVISDTFTFDNLRILTQAIADAIALRQAERAERTKISSDRVLLELARIAVYALRTHSSSGRRSPSVFLHIPSCRA